MLINTNIQNRQPLLAVIFLLSLFLQCGHQAPRLSITTRLVTGSMTSLASMSLKLVDTWIPHLGQVGAKLEILL